MSGVVDPEQSPQAEGCPRPGRNWNQSSSRGSRGDGAAEGRGAVCLGVRGIAASQNGGVLIQRSSFGDPGAQLPSVLQRSSGVQASMVMVGCRASPLSMPLDVLWSELPLLLFPLHDFFPAVGPLVAVQRESEGGLLVY